jgi:uncharacterized membrane protein YdbT with pleckstrin-like domain
LLSFIPAWVKRRTTELAVTNRRVIYKRGFVRRHTIEMNMDKVESVDVDQSFWGRIFNYGTIVVHGTGGSLEPLVRRKIEIESVTQLSGKRDAAHPARASRPQCRSGDPALSEPMRKGPAGLLSDAGAIG